MISTPIPDPLGGSGDPNMPPLISPNGDEFNPDFMSNVFSVGLGVLVVGGVLFFFLVRFLRKRMKEKEELAAKAFRVEPVYQSSIKTTKTEEDPAKVSKASLEPGWYALPDGTQDRYHDGDGWTEFHREWTPEGRLTDPAPSDYVKKEKVEPVIEEEVESVKIVERVIPVYDPSAPKASDDRLIPDSEVFEKPIELSSDEIEEIEKISIDELKRRRTN